MNSYITFQGQSGTSLVSTMIAVAASGLLAVSLAKMSTSSFQAQKSAEISQEKTRLRNQLNLAVDCGTTLPASVATCNSSTYIPLLRSNGGELVAANGAQGTPYGFFNVRARCTPSRLIIEAGKPIGSSTTEFAVDPLTNRTLSWQDIFEGRTPICDSYFGGGSGPTGGPRVTEFSIGSGSLSILSPARRTAGLFTSNIGSQAYTASGNMLEIHTRLNLGARGLGRTARVRVSVFNSAGTRIFTNAEVHAVSAGIDCQTTSIGSQDGVFVPVIRGGTYSIHMILESEDSGSSDRCGSDYPWVVLNSRVHTIIKDYSI